MKKNFISKSAFTLVELAIVLVIIGLLVVGVVGGQSLVESAKLQRAATEARQILTAINAFRLEYNGLPGDFREASLYGIGTDGNGDKIIDPAERNNFFIHMVNANILTNTSVTPTKFKSALGDDSEWYAASSLVTGSIPAYGVRSNAFDLTNMSCSVSWCSVLTPKQANAFDAKLDDGKATLGNVSAANGHDFTIGCTTANLGNGDYQQPAGSAEYRLTNTNKDCRMFVNFK